MLNKVTEILEANSEETRHPQWGVVRLFTEDAILAAAEQILTTLQPNSECQPLLQQADCYAAFEFLEQELIKEQKAAGNARFERDYGTHVNKANSISFVINLIKERQANAV